MRARFLTILVILAVCALAWSASGARGQEAVPDASPAAASPVPEGTEGSPAVEGSPAPEGSPAVEGSPAPEASPGAASPGPSPEATGSPIPFPSASPDFSPTEGIWISDSENGRIVYMLNMEGERYLSIGFPGRGPGRFLRPEQVWVDIDGRIYLADRGNDRIVRLDDLQGAGYTEMGGFNEPYGVATHGERIFVADTGNDRILVYREWGGEPVATLSDAKIRRPTYLWVDLEGNLYVAAGEDPPGGRIVRVPVNLDAAPSTWEVYEGRGVEGGSFAPSQVVTTERGMFLVDASADRIVRVDNFAGRDARQMGGYGSRAGEFLRPTGMGTDEEGRLYVADTGNDRIVRFDNISGDEWCSFESMDPGRSLRGPRSVFVWAPRPPKPVPSPSPSPKEE